MREHDPKCPRAFPMPTAICDCGADHDPKTSLGRKMDGFGNGCAVTAGRVAGTVTVWSIAYWISRHDIAQAAAWFTQHVRIVP